MANKYKILAINTIVFAIGNIISKIILFLLLPLYTHVLTTSEYGVAELITTISQLVIPVASLAITESVYRFSLDKGYNSGEVLKNGLTILSLSSIIIIVSGFFLRYYDTVSDWVFFYCAVSIFSMFRSMLSLYVQATGKTKLFAVDNVIYNFSLAIFNIIFLTVFKMSLNGYFMAMVFSAIISIVFISIFGGIIKDLSYKTVKFNLLKDMLKYSMPLVLNSISWSVAHLVDKVMLSNMDSTSATGVYSAASKIPAIVSLVTSVFSQAWGLSAIKDFDEERDTSFFENVFLMLHISVVVSVLVVYVFNSNLLKYILGREFEEAVLYTPILLLAAVFLAYSNYYTPIFQAAKSTKNIMITAFGGAVINVILNVILIKKYQIMGACIATTISYLFIAVSRMYLSSKIIKITVSRVRFIISIIILTILMFITSIVESNYYYNILGIIIIIGIYYNNIKTALIKVTRRRWFK